MDNLDLKNQFFKLFNSYDELEIRKQIIQDESLSNSKNWVTLEKIDSLNHATNQTEDSVLNLISCIQTFINASLRSFQQTNERDLQLLADGNLATPNLTLFSSKYNLPINGFKKGDIPQEFLNLLNHLRSNSYVLVVNKLPIKTYYTILQRTLQNTDITTLMYLPKGELPQIESSCCQNLSLYKTQYLKGTLLKVYSYNLPSNSRSVISRNLKASIEDFMFDVKYPFMIVDRNDRFPKDTRLERIVRGKQYVLKKLPNRYIYHTIEKNQKNEDIGKIAVTAYLLNYSIDSLNYRKSLSILKRDIFKHKMKVVFTIDGVVRHYYTDEFLKSIGYGALKDYLFIQVDCDQMKLVYRNMILSKDVNNITTLVINNSLSSILNEIKEILNDFREKTEKFKH